MEIQDIDRVYRLFLDVQRSTQYLMEYQSQYINEVSIGDGDDDDVNAMVTE